MYVHAYLIVCSQITFLLSNLCFQATVMRNSVCATLYSIMRNCWCHDENSRPSAFEINNWLSQLLEKVNRKINKKEKHQEINLYTWLDKNKYVPWTESGPPAPPAPLGEKENDYVPWDDGGPTPLNENDYVPWDESESVQLDEKQYIEWNESGSTKEQYVQWDEKSAFTT